MGYCIIIPARYASTRFPGKPLADIGGKTMIRRVWDCAMQCTDAEAVLVATDDQQILDHVNEFGRAVLTSSEHPSGTDRCREAYATAGLTSDIVVNIQGDEPFIQAAQVQALVDIFGDEKAEIATLKKSISLDTEIDNPNVVKVVCDIHGRALYFSRSRIPYNRENQLDTRYYRHLGMYAYRADALKKITELPPSVLEETEKLEQLRWLENGYHIAVAETKWQSPAVDTPEDLEKAIEFMRRIETV